MNTKEYMRQYMKRRYHERKDRAILFLGGKCIKCGTVEDLQFDHKDRKGKGFTISMLWSINEKDFWVEVKKCQLLCRKCHNIKTLDELGRVSARDRHGTLSSFRYCKCDICRAAARKWFREYMRKRRASSSAVSSS